ncbi:hypothetical protein DL96DRAFT_738646 [Flagelloscypha sp. PMI_526]|nr:hypothetical protein DL96DRAFT_738646 [Flagelloscypha sp. PMI_526]
MTSCGLLDPYIPMVCCTFLTLFLFDMSLCTPSTPTPVTLPWSQSYIGGLRRHEGQVLDSLLNISKINGIQGKNKSDQPVSDCQEFVESSIEDGGPHTRSKGESRESFSNWHCYISC